MGVVGFIKVGVGIIPINTFDVLLVTILHLGNKNVISTSVFLNLVFQEKKWLIKMGIVKIGGKLNIEKSLFEKES